MKDFRKNKEGLIICEECGETLKNIRGLSAHVQMKHNSKTYFDTYIKEKTDGICKICKNDTKFISLSQGYLVCCSESCIHQNKSLSWKQLYGNDFNIKHKERIKRKKDTQYKKYNNENFNNIEKRKVTCKNLYDDENYHNIKKEYETKMLLYGNYNNHEKYIQTCVERYSVDNVFFSLNFKEKRKRTLIQKYNVEHPSQDKDIHEKQLKNSLKIKRYKDTNIWYQGKYELDFLEKFYEKYLDIQRGPSIKFINNNKTCYYHPDFYIPSLNLIIEIKSSYYLKLNENLISKKEKATIANGFNYLMILDKKYAELYNYLQK